MCYNFKQRIYLRGISTIAYLQKKIVNFLFRESRVEEIGQTTIFNVLQKIAKNRSMQWEQTNHKVGFENNSPEINQ